MKPVITKRPEQPVEPVTWSGWRLTGPLAEWRTDDDGLSGPFCVVCDGRIAVGDRYALALPHGVACVPCSGLKVPPPRADRCPRPIGPSRVGSVTQ